MHQLIDIFMHLPEHLHAWASAYGVGLYLILFFIIFAETGFIVTPFLPGDSLLFATGALLSLNIEGLNLPTMAILLILAAILGDAVNYRVGRWMAPRLFSGQKIRWLNPKHLQRTREFYDKHGGKTIILARFVPIVRTYAPFVAGLGGMPYARFGLFNVIGGVVWILSFLLLGYFFGTLPVVKTNFQYVILGIIFVSVLPIAIEFIRARRASLAPAAKGS